MILAPLRGVTIRCFRETFAEQIREAGFTEAITPFLSANPGFWQIAHTETQRHRAQRETPCPQWLCVTKSKSLRSSSEKIQNLCARAFYG